MEIIFLVVGLVAGLSYGGYVGYKRGAVHGFEAREFFSPLIVSIDSSDGSFIGHDYTDEEFLGQSDTYEGLIALVTGKYPGTPIIAVDAK